MTKMTIPRSTAFGGSRRYDDDNTFVTATSRQFTDDLDANGSELDHEMKFSEKPQPLRRISALTLLEKRSILSKKRALNGDSASTGGSIKGFYNGRDEESDKSIVGGVSTNTYMIKS